MRVVGNDHPALLQQFKLVVQIETWLGIGGARGTKEYSGPHRRMQRDRPYWLFFSDFLAEEVFDYLDDPRTAHSRYSRG